MKKTLIVLLLSMIYSISAVALSTEIQFDMLKEKLKQELADKEYSNAVDTISRIKSLNVSIPDALQYFEGKALFESGKPAQSYDKFERYISNTGQQGKYYKSAINYLIKAEDAISKQKESKKRQEKEKIEAKRRQEKEKIAAKKRQKKEKIAAEKRKERSCREYRTKYRQAKDNWNNTNNHNYYNKLRRYSDKLDRLCYDVNY